MLPLPTCPQLPDPFRPLERLQRVCMPSLPPLALQACVHLGTGPRCNGYTRSFESTRWCWRRKPCSNSCSQQYRCVVVCIIRRTPRTCKGRRLASPPYWRHVQGGRGPWMAAFPCMHACPPAAATSKCDHTRACAAPHGACLPWLGALTVGRASSRRGGREGSRRSHMTCTRAARSHAHALRLPPVQSNHVIDPWVMPAVAAQGRGFHLAAGVLRQLAEQTGGCDQRLSTLVISRLLGFKRRGIEHKHVAYRLWCTLKATNPVLDAASFRAGGAGAGWRPCSQPRRRARARGRRLPRAPHHMPSSAASLCKPRRSRGTDACGGCM